MDERARNRRNQGNKTRGKGKAGEDEDEKFGVYGETGEEAWSIGRGTCGGGGSMGK